MAEIRGNVLNTNSIAIHTKDLLLPEIISNIDFKTNSKYMLAKLLQRLTHSYIYCFPTLQF